MTRVPVGIITRERLAKWGDDCILAHATPALLIAFGHDEYTGEWHIYVPDDPMFTDETIRSILRQAVGALPREIRRISAP